MAKPLTRRDLDAAIYAHQYCADPLGHDELFISPRCHVGSGTIVVYRKGTGVLKVTCDVCSALVVEIAVALKLDTKG